jgi:serine/threonine protein phosphatase PrpC
MIIACDGIWDVLEDQEAVDMVREYLRRHPVLPASAGKDLAHVLIEASLAKGTSDNVTACVVLL